MLKGVDTIAFNPAIPVNFNSTDISGTPGSGVINTPSGRFAIAAGQVQITITCALCTPSSKVLPMVRSNDNTMKSMIAIPGAGSFVVRGNANATGITQGAFVLFN